MSKKTNNKPVTEDVNNERIETLGLVEVEQISEEPETVTVAESVCFVGNSIPHVVATGTIFKDGVLTDALSAFIEKNPIAKNLLIPLSRLNVALRDLNDKQSALYKIRYLVSKIN